MRETRPSAHALSALQGSGCVITFCWRAQRSNRSLGHCCSSVNALRHCDSETERQGNRGFTAFHPTPPLGGCVFGAKIFLSPPRAGSEYPYAPMATQAPALILCYPETLTPRNPVSLFQCCACSLPTLCQCYVCFRVTLRPGNKSVSATEKLPRTRRKSI
jgi:hypothetical protein